MHFQHTKKVILRKTSSYKGIERQHVPSHSQERSPPGMSLVLKSENTDSHGSAVSGGELGSWPLRKPGCKCTVLWRKHQTLSAASSMLQVELEVRHRYAKCPTEAEP